MEYYNIKQQVHTIIPLNIGNFIPSPMIVFVKVHCQTMIAINYNGQIELHTVENDLNFTH